MTDAIVTVLRALIDAAFSSGGITDRQHTDLHGQLDAAAAEPASEPAAPVTDEAPTTAPPAESNPYA